jgi:alpha-D-ribose 1-methylphosphonate 5-triphosphate synthase subunit PhnI
MGYVAVTGGERAIANAEQLLKLARAGGDAPLLDPRQIREQLHFAVDRVMSEGSLYAPELAALAFKQAAGDTFEAAFMLRAYRTTLPRFGATLPVSTAALRVVRRISAAFKEIPGGQVLGPTPDYALRLLDFSLRDEDQEATRDALRRFAARFSDSDPLPDRFPKIVELLRREGLLAVAPADRGAGLADITRQALTFPASRSARLQSLARGETGGMLALAYSNMRGYGSVHPVIGELRVGHLALPLSHPVEGQAEIVGEIEVTEAEVISRIASCDGPAMFSLGYGLCFGHNETKAIAMAVLDRAISTGEAGGAPSEDEEFVLTHIDGIESMGFCNHYKLPHYVTFQSDLDRLRRIRAERSAAAPESGATAGPLAAGGP